MAIDTTLRSNAGALAGTGAGNAVANPARPVAARSVDQVDTKADSKDTAAPAKTTQLRSGSSAGAIGGELQGQVARAQQALDYLDQVAGQLENLKGELSAKLSSSRNQQRSSPHIDNAARQLSHTLAARKSSAGGGVDANLNFDGQPAQQRFRIRGLDLDSLQQNAPQTLAFSVAGAGGPNLSATITSDQSSGEAARAIDRALAPLGVHASLDRNGGLVFSTAESDWPAVKESIAVSGRGRVATEEVPAELAPQQWTGGNADALRQSLREVVQALERVRRSQDAASSALSSASAQLTDVTTPPPEVELAAEDFASAAQNTNYDSLLALTSALVGVSRERVLALLGLR